MATDPLNPDAIIMQLLTEVETVIEVYGYEMEKIMPRHLWARLEGSRDIGRRYVDSLTVLR